MEGALATEMTVPIGGGGTVILSISPSLAIRLFKLLETKEDFSGRRDFDESLPLLDDEDEVVVDMTASSGASMVSICFLEILWLLLIPTSPEQSAVTLENPARNGAIFCVWVLSIDLCPLPRASKKLKSHGFKPFQDVAINCVFSFSSNSINWLDNS